MLRARVTGRLPGRSIFTWSAEPTMIPGLCRFLLLLTVLAAAPLGAQETGSLVIRGGRLWNGLGDSAVRNPGIWVQAGRIMAVGGPLPSGARTLELADNETILPGFFDLHAHYAVDLFGRGRVDEREGYPLLFLANGVTSTFPAGEVNPDQMRELRIAIDGGERIGPRIFNSGPYFGGAREGWDTTTSAEWIRAEVDRWAALGVRGFKAKRMGPEPLRVLIEQAHRHGLTVTGHLDSGYRGSVNPRDAILMGIDRVEHFLGGDAIAGDRPAYESLVDFRPGTPAFDSIAALYRRHRVFFDATLTAYGYFGAQDPRVFEDFASEARYLTPYMRQVVAKRPPREVNAQFERIYRAKLRTIKAFYDAGGGELITLGTDHPSWGQFFSPFGVHRELHALVLAGIPPAAALRAATINAAHALGVADRLGTVEPGKWADLVVIRGDPLRDIRATRDVRRVVKAGVPHDAAELRRRAEGRIGPAGPEEVDRWGSAPP